VKIATIMSAKIFLRRLTDMSTFTTLQDKLSRLNDTYLVSVMYNTYRSSNDNSVLYVCHCWLITADKIFLLNFFSLVKFVRYKCISMYWYYWAQCTCSTRTFQTPQSCFSWRHVFALINRKKKHDHQCY